ncbi:hypothetical protein LTR85_007869 [Meristemomyces frigidus]|nr:hypothetical protein LTR85_007869 [Meristemomyces frigidus]
MFYSVALKTASSTDPSDESTKAKLRSNLWLAFNNVRILLEPSDTNMQALLILVSFAGDIMTPSLCWMLVTNACSMLQALGVLEAAAVTEKPFLDAKSAANLDYGLKTMRFQFCFLSVLLILPCKELRDQSTRLSRQMLGSLDDMMWETEDGEEPHPGFVWQLIFCPLTPFLALFGGILSKGQADLEQNREALEAMEHLPPFLRKLSPRYPLATKLEAIAVKFVVHTRSILSRQDEANEEAPNPSDTSYPTPETLQSAAIGLAPDPDPSSVSFGFDHFSPDSIDWMFWDHLIRDPDSRLTGNPESVTGAGRLWYEQ